MPQRKITAGGVGNPVAVLEMGDVQAAAGALGLTVVPLEIRRAEDIAPAFEAPPAQRYSIITFWPQYDRLPAQAADLVRRQVNVLAATSTPAALAAKEATTTIPIVFTTAGDPVQLGLVPALSRPTGNITGVTALDVEIAPKRLQLARELVPTATMMALLVNPTFAPTERMSRELAVAAENFGLKLHVVHATTESEIDEAFATVAQLQAGALVIGTDVFLASRMEQLGTLTLRHALPTVFEYRDFATAGGLISYGGSITEMYRNAGIYVGRILRGEKPASLPVQQATKIELIINLKTARALGLTIPTSLLVRADEVIE